MLCQRCVISIHLEIEWHGVCMTLGEFLNKKSTPPWQVGQHREGAREVWGLFCHQLPVMLCMMVCTKSQLISWILNYLIEADLFDHKFFWYISFILWGAGPNWAPTATVWHKLCLRNLLIAIPHGILTDSMCHSRQRPFYYKKGS